MNESVTQIKDMTGNPAPLGLLGFGMTTVLLNLHNAGFYELNSMILAMGVCYGGAAQIIARMMSGGGHGIRYYCVSFLRIVWGLALMFIILAKLGWASLSTHMAMALVISGHVGLCSPLLCLSARCGCTSQGRSCLVR